MKDNQKEVNPEAEGKCRIIFDTFEAEYHIFYQF